MFNAEDPAHVTAPTNGPAIVKSAQFAVAVIVTVYAVAFERLSKMTLSAEVGTLAPVAPPEDALQCVVVEASQFPVPQTQYRSIYSKLSDIFCFSSPSRSIHMTLST